MNRTWLFHVLISLCFINYITAVSVETQNLLGCGSITRPSRIYPYSPANYDFNLNTPATCMQACSAAGYAYASVSAGRLCFCGSLSTNISLLSSTTTLCQIEICTGNSNVYCGDNYYELVYTSMGVIDSASIVLIGGTSPMALQINQNYQFAVSYQGAVSYINYLIDFGDGTQTDWFNGILNTPTIVSHIFSKTGKFSISMAARSLVGMQPVMSAMTVKVSDQISSLDVSMTCPNVTVTQKTISCIFTSIRGTDLTAKLNYNSSTPSHSIINVPNAQYYIFGSSYVTHNPTIDSSGNLLTINDIVILPQSTITIAGRIASIQFYSSGAGTINIYLLRPSCTSPLTYCYNTNTCGSCTNPYSLQCSTNIYSTITHLCVNTTLTQRFQQSTYSNVQFEIIAQWTITTTGINYQQIIANSSLNMMNKTALVGDILAFKGLYIAKNIAIDGTEDYRCLNPTIASNIFTCSIGSLSSNNTKYRYLLQTTIIQAIQIAPNTIYDNVGYYSVEGQLTQNNLTTYSASTILPVIYGIESINITGPSVTNVNATVTFQANIYPANATATIYMWYIDGNYILNSTTNMMNTSFPLIGTYTIGCQAQNLLSTRYASTSIVIEDIIQNFTLHAGNLTNVSTSHPFETAQFQLRMTTGSNYACHINYDTSQSVSRLYYYTYGYIPGSYVSHQYLQPGEYNVYAYCENSVSNVSYSFIHYVQYAISGLQLQQRGIGKNTNFRLNFTIAQGTAPQFRIIVNGIQVNYTYNEQYNLVQTDYFPGQSSSINYTVEAYAWNYISSSYISNIFAIVSPIINPQIRSSVINTYFPGPILFEYTMESGSNIDILFSFGDTITNNPVLCQYYGDYPTNVWNYCPNTNHTFEIPGTLTIVVAFTNPISTVYKYLTITLTTSVNPIEVLTNLQTSASQCAAAFVDNRAIASFIIRSTNTISKPASNAQLIIIPDSINQPTIKRGPFQLTFNYFASPAITSSGLDVIYTALGNYTAVFQVSNSMDSTSISCIVQVVPTLQQVYYSINSLNWPLNGINSFKASVYIGDPNPGIVMITWNFGDGTIISRTRIETQFDAADTESHLYLSVGTYTLTIIVQGPMNTITKNFSINVEYAVSSFIVNFTNIIGSSDQLIYGGTPKTISINVLDLSIPFTSNSRLFIDYNDTSLLATNNVINVALPYYGSYTFFSPGIYLVNFTVYNRVSSITQIIKIGINAPFDNYQFTVCYLLPTLTSSLSDTCNLTLNNGFYYIPKQSQLVIYVTWTNPDGIPELFDVFFKSSSIIVFNQSLTISQVTNVYEIVGVTTGSPLYRLVIDLENNPLLIDGLYTIEVKTRNPSRIGTYSLNIFILSMIAGLTINDKNILVPMNVPKIFQAKYQNFSSLSCLYIQYSDNINECYGDSLTCLSLPNDLSSILQTCSLPIQTFIYENSSILFTRTFNTSYAWLHAYAWNSITLISSRSYFSFPLSSDGCSLPIVQFNIYNPIIRWARRIQRSEAFSIAVQIGFNCSRSLNNTKQWNILQCNTDTEICYQTPLLNQLISQLLSAKTSEIYIRSQMLPIGTYLFNFTVSMNLQTKVSTSDYTYIKIIPSNIRVNLLANGTSMITNGITQSLLFQPGVYSIDPDSNYFNAENWTFKYYCRIYQQASYPSFDGEEITIDSNNIDPANPSCFSSPGNTTYFKYGPNNNQSILYIQPHALQSGRSYEFKAILTNIYDTSLKYTGYVLVQIQDANSVLISAKMCLPNVEYQRINPTTQALLTSSCIDNCDNITDIIIQWSVYRGFTTGYPNNDIRWILYTNMSAYDDILFYGRNTKNFTVVNTLFLSNPAVIYWKFESTYTVTTRNGVATGTGAVRFVINSPPQNGTCTSDRTNGTTMTLFQFTCLNWADADGISGYTFYAYTSTSTTRILIGFTTLANVAFYLPIGDPNANYALQLTAEIRDVYGAINSYNFSTLTVIPDNGSLTSFIELTQQSSTQSRANNPIERLLYAGDQNTASQLVLSLSQTLNSISSNIRENAALGNIPAQNLYVAGLSASASSYPTTNTSADTSEAIASYTAALNAEANVRDYAIRFINNLPITTIDSVKLQASTMNHLTTATSALTRQAVTSAQSKANDLINALNEMVDTISYEDVQMAVESIVQLASNILVAVNTPLMERGTVLNLDYDRSNMLPPDYETDIESVWSNPNLFADGDDFSWETIQKNRNLYYQQQDSNGVVEQIDGILSKAINVLSYHINVGQTNVINTDSISMKTEKQRLDKLNSLTISQAAGTQINLPALSYCSLLLQNESCSNSTPITINSVVLPLATAGYNGRTETNTNMSRSVSLSLFDSSGTTIPLTNLPTPIEIIIPRDPNLLLPSMTLQNITAQTTLSKGNNNRQFSIYYINVTSSTKNLTLSATFEFKSDNLLLGYIVVFRFDAVPILNSTMNQTDGYRIFCPTAQILTTNDGYIYSYFLDNTRTINHEYVIFGIRELDSTEFDIYCSNNISLSSSILPITDAAVNFTSNYYIRAYTSACYYLDENSYWQTKDMVVGPQTTSGQTQCYTNHLTTFAGGWIVLPAPINWNYVFANADFSKNKTIYLTMILIAVFYILIMIYARYKDKKDVEKLGVTPLPDNLISDKYYYQIIVFTGFRKDAGTNSKVHFVISGDDETGVRTFEDPHRKILQRGSIDSFIMAVPKSLGQLNYMRVWHDNSGSRNGASWFLKYIIVRDLQTMEKNHFICQQWFAVEKDDGAIDRLIPVAGDAQKKEFAYLLSKKTYHSMSDGHLWFSVFSRPPSTRFTRTQRCTCCFVLLLMSMLMNIMYYDQNTAAKSKTVGGITMGPFYISPEQIAIGIIVELICFLPSTILVEMFRRLRPRRRPVSPVRKALQRMQNEHQEKQKQAALSDIHPQLTNYIINPDPILSRNELDRMRNTLASPLPNKQINQQEFQLKKKKKKLTLPWWFIFIAYGLSFLVVSVSILFIIARGIEFGDLKTRQWLTSSITGFFSSIFLTQPIKVIFLAIFFALFIRRDDDDNIIDSDNDDIFLDGDEEYLHALDDRSLLTFRSKSGHIPLTQGELADARHKRLNEIKMWAIIRELLAYSSFLWILYVVSYSNRDPNAFYLMKHLRADLLDVNSATNDFTKIYNVDQYWNWLSTSFVPHIRASKWYNDAPPINLTGYINDKTNRILGWSTMRQLRVKPHSCTVVSSFQNITTSCEAGYNIFNEEQHSFNPGWTSIYDPTIGHIGNYSLAINKAFMFNKSESLDTYTYVGEHATYGGGGYVYEFRGRMSEMLANISLLRQLSWIDMQTRAVIIQMSLYNPNVNLFVFVTILAEFLPTGGIYPSARVEPISLLNYYQGFGLFKLICAIVYMIFIIYYMQREIRSIFKRRKQYFRDIWSYTEIGLIACSWTGLVIYIWRIREGNRISTLFKQTNGYAYINLQLASYVNDILTFLLGFCCFFGTVKFLRLLRFNQRMSMLASTLVYAAKDLISFSVMFSIIYLGYLALFFLLFHSKIWACSTPLSTAQMLFEMMLLKFDVSDLYAANIFLGPFCFTLFVIFVVFICMNMFISIISDSFRIVRHNMSLQNSEHEIIEFMTNQFKKWTGIGRPKELDRLHLNPFDGTRVHYHDPITSFPNKMDELIIALNKIYMDTKRNDTLIFRPIDNNTSEIIEKTNVISDKTDKKFKD
ncbi:unnamed protein product [Rotaria sordida]|uniref:PKD domain-containing protein n=1 Tax=Rotaria sordida TaxID=392033 RepID=A0A818HFD4_9BILA|nr:unnamed protein product [Rotaria sordida]